MISLSVMFARSQVILRPIVEATEMLPKMNDFLTPYFAMATVL